MVAQVATGDSEIRPHKTSRRQADSGAAVSADTLGAWVFKCNPNVYDLPGEVADGQGYVDNWSVVSNYRSAMIQAGQRAILWMSGATTGNAPRGVWGIGWTVGPRYEGVAGGGYWLDQKHAEAVKFLVPTSIRVLADTDRVRADEISRSSGLQDLEVFTAPFGSNPSWISKEQLAKLEKLLPTWPAPDDIPDLPISIGGRGAGFGDVETNKLVEAAAVKAVSEYLRNDWNASVEDVSAENLGWDLTATMRDGSEWHVEVKGVSGVRPVVLLTSNEWRTAQRDPSWELAVVTNALSDKPIVTVYDADQSLKCAQPFVMRVDLGEEQGWGA